MRLLLISLFVLSSTFMAWSNPPRFSKDLRTLTTWLQGDYDNSAQLRRDTSVTYAEAHIVRIWENLYTDAIWLYEEINDREGKPISQRFYRFSDGADDTYEAIVYELPDVAKFAGEYKAARPFEDFNPETDLTGLVECTIYFRKKGDNKYSGSTVGKECLFNRGGKVKFWQYQIDVYEAKVMRADRGIGWNDEIVAGPAKESKGYEFKRPVVKPEKPKPAPKSSKSKSKKS